MSGTQLLECSDILFLKWLPPAGVPPLQVHQGFYNGVKRHLPAVQELVSARAAAASDLLLTAGSGALRPGDSHAGSSGSGKAGGKRKLPPLWVTGHSLGGGYANCLTLHMLANRSTAELFGGGELRRC